ncbi:MAG: hypothetical protein U1E15_10150 [Hyphomicrobiales bacterium]
MSKLMYVLGIILLAAGVALLVMWVVNSAPCKPTALIWQQRSTFLLAEYWPSALPV